MNFLHSTLDAIRDRYTPVTHTSTFRNTGQITPEDFISAGDFLVYKFPSWSWSDASHPTKRVAYLPDNKQYLVTRGVPCHRRLNDNFAGDAGMEETIVQDGLVSGGGATSSEDGWLRTGGVGEKEQTRLLDDVRTLDGSGNVNTDREEYEEAIPDMEDEEDDSEAIIRDPREAGAKAALRNYNVYITYTPYYRTPRLYLSGYLSSSEPLPPAAMMDDIIGDYKDKTVTLEDFPFFDASQAVKMASVHPCRHASVMKVLLARADAALRLRKERVLRGGEARPALGMEGLVDDVGRLEVSSRGHRAGVALAGGAGGDEWEVLQHEGQVEDDVAIRVDQYLVVFLKFMASVMPGIEHDFTMGV